LAVEPRQCTYAESDFGPPVLAEKQIPTLGTHPTVTRSCPMQPFLFQKLEKSPKGTHFQSSKYIYKKRAKL